MKFITIILSRIWSITFLLFFSLIIFSALGGNLPDWAASYLSICLQLFTDWGFLIVLTAFAIFGYSYGNKVGWKTVGNKIGKHFQSNTNDEFQFKLGVLSLSKLLFGASIIFVALSLSLFNYELRKKPECTINLLDKKTNKCIIDSNLTSNFRIVVHSGGNRETVNIKIPIDVFIDGITTNTSFTNVYPDTASTGGDGRYHSNLNYGIYDLPDSPNTTITIAASNDVMKLNLFEAKILTNPNDWFKKIFSTLFLVTLLLSIYFRHNTFKKGLLRPLPYLVFSAIALIVIF